MKKYLLIVVNIVLFIQLHSQSYVDKKGNVHLWGNTDADELKSEPYQEWFGENSAEYESCFTKADSGKFENIKVKIFLGTWCGDTKFLVPKFIKTWDQIGLSHENLEIIALHNKGDLYKQGPNRETDGLNIHKVPTFIFEKDGYEIGRIVERTVFDLDTDIHQIVTGQPYEERYQAVSILDRIMNEMDMDSLFLKENIKTIFNKIRREVSTSSELNAYGYVLKAQGAIEKAEFVFLLNTYLFKYEPNVHDSYGEILMTLERWAEAKQQYEEVIRLKGSDDHAVAQLYAINEAIKLAEEHTGE